MHIRLNLQQNILNSMVMSFALFYKSDMTIKKIWQKQSKINHNNAIAIIIQHKHFARSK
jgi:hypothetical protein